VHTGPNIEISCEPSPLVARKRKRSEQVVDKQFGVNYPRKYPRDRAKIFRNDEKLEKAWSAYMQKLPIHNWERAGGDLLDWEVFKVELASKGIPVDTQFPDIMHGDVVYFMDYRGCGAYIAFDTGERLFLVKTIEEYGRMIPPHFSDAPVEYYDFSEICVAIDYMIPGSDLEGIVTEEIEKIKGLETYEGKTNYDDGENVIDETFPRGYLAIYENDQWGFFPPEPEDQQQEEGTRSLLSRTFPHLDFENYTKNFIFPLPRHIEQTTNMLTHIFRGVLAVPDILGLISSFVLAPPFPTRADDSIDLPPAKRKKISNNEKSPPENLV